MFLNVRPTANGLQAAPWYQSLPGGSGQRMSQDSAKPGRKVVGD